MNKRKRNRKIREGNAVIAKAGLTSQEQIDAYNLWRAVTFLQDKLNDTSMRIHEVRAEDVAKWLS